jgi:hypothetical protein
MYIRLVQNSTAGKSNDGTDTLLWEKKASCSAPRAELTHRVRIDSLVSKKDLDALVVP